MQSICAVRVMRFVWPVFTLMMLALGVYGLLASLGGSCGDDPHDCESDYMFKALAIYHASFYIGAFFAMFWAGSFCASRLRGWVMLILLIGPTIWLWSNSDVKSDCEDFYDDNCAILYNYAKMCRFADVAVVLCLMGAEIIAFTTNLEDDDGKNVDLTVIDHLYFREDEGWKKPLLVDSQIRHFKDNIKGWQEVATNRNKTLSDAVKIASSTHADSSTQCKQLGKYSSLIEESSEKVTRASQLLDDQAGLLTKLNQTVNEVISVMGSSADLDLSNFTAMSAQDCKSWCYVSLLCCLITITLFLGIPRWLHLFDISLGIKI